ncbi:Gfo/Idh/MocA family oxidoreductase [Clostridium tyrobutyricum]|uniref:Gfo/Idh/MocA family oxidoreductase n=1 Tax=Clostridium tyrobutyricum TaxID=1519 RepID=UPI001C38F340|nr:Gfo/Idh/MocA family oxidoreductase [Clostridium tyrobutyricum]MBV4431226.1 Gfo/Idh/MocA family oxidoreductase [Clostridium tyrobutyricum]
MELKIGVIGTGAIGKTHIERITNKLKGGKITAVSDANIENGKKVAQKYNARFEESGEALISADDVDAVIVTSWDQTHEKYVLEAIKNKKYVFCEKPLAPDQEGCKRIIKEEMAGGKKLVQVGFMRRYDAGYKQLKKLIENKTYGEPLMLHCAHRNPSVDESYTTPMAVENSMIHEIDVLRWLLGEDYSTVEVVFAKKTKYAHENLQDPQIMILTTKSGVRIDVEAFVNCHYGYDIKCEVACEEGIINLPEPSNPMVRTDASRITPICGDWSERFVDAYNEEFQQWINATLEDRVDGPTAWDGYVGSITAAAASKARDTKSVVKINIEECPEFYKG